MSPDDKQLVQQALDVGWPPEAMPTLLYHVHKESEWDPELRPYLQASSRAEIVEEARRMRDGLPDA